MNLEELLDAARLLPDSSQRFPDGGQYRVEIPSVEGAGTAELVLDTAAGRERRGTAPPRPR